MSMYRQLWLAVIVSTLLALLGGLLASTLSARTYLSQQLTSKNTDNASALALALSRQNPDAVMVDLAVASLFDSGHYELVRVTDPSGKVMSERSAPGSRHEVPKWFAALLPIESAPGQAQITNGWTQIGTLTLVSNSGAAYSSLWTATLQLIGALGLSGLVGGFLGVRMLGRMRRSLQSVIDQAEAVSRRNFVTIAEPDIPELRHLAAAMNTMVGRLKAMFMEQADRLDVKRLQANADELTGLPNQTFLLLQLLEALESDEKVNGALLLVRLVRLTQINAQLGQAGADRFLIDAAAVMDRHAKAEDAMAFRFRDADFGILLPPGIDVHSMARKLMDDLEALGHRFELDHLVIAMGMARLQREQDVASLMAQASQALAAAAATGANTLREVQAEGTPAELDNSQWLTLFEDALDANRVRLSSQAVLDLQGRLIHDECVLEVMFEPGGRWQQTSRYGQIAEQLDLTPRLDLTAIKLALEQLEGRPQLPGLSVCISVASTLDVQFRRRLNALLDHRAAAARRLALQVPEFDAVRHLTEFKEFCTGLKKSGCAYGLQHVGRQLSDIALLHDLGPDFLKVDSSFVRGLQYSLGNQEFLQGLSSIAHHIGTQVYAEGVIDQAELREIARLGFDGASGPAVKPAV